MSMHQQSYGLARLGEGLLRAGVGLFSGAMAMSVAGRGHVHQVAKRSIGALRGVGTVRTALAASFRSIWYFNPERLMSQSGRPPG